MACKDYVEHLHCSETDSETNLPSDLNGFQSHLFPILDTLKINYILTIFRYWRQCGHICILSNWTENQSQKQLSSVWSDGKVVPITYFEFLKK